MSLFNGPMATLKIVAVPQDENLDLGFIPAYVSVFNETTGIELEWFSTFASGKNKKTLATGVVTTVTSGTFTIKDGTDGTPKGVFLPSAIASASDVLHVKVLREATDAISLRPQP